MCVVIYADGARIGKRMFERAFRTNPHGGGLAWWDGGRWNAVKGFMDEKSFWRAYEEVQHFPVVLHFRRDLLGRPAKAEWTHPHVLELSDGKAFVFYNGSANTRAEHEPAVVWLVRELSKLALSKEQLKRFLEQRFYRGVFPGRFLVLLQKERKPIKVGRWTKIGKRVWVSKPVDQWELW